MTPYELDVRHEHDGLAVVELAGELDLTNVSDVESSLDEITGDRLILDLNKVTFIDSAALHMLFRTARRFESAQRLGIVLEPSAIVARTLAIVEMAEVATICPTLGELVATDLSPVIRSDQPCSHRRLRPRFWPGGRTGTSPRPF